MSWLENRIPPPLVAAAFALGMWACARWLPGMTMRFFGQTPLAGVALAAGLGVIAVAVARFIGENTTVDPLHPEAASALVTGGIFRITRNPMYLGMSLVLVAWGLWLGNVLAALGVPGFVSYINRFQIVPEERALRSRFGDEFEVYARAVRRWL